MSSEAGVESPATVDELAALLRQTEVDGTAVTITGAGSKATWGAAAASPDVVVDTTRLTGLVEHAVGDLVVTVRAGTPLAALQDELRATNQWLALDPPERDATVGGVVATAAAGPHRLRFGTPRDQLIGVTVVLADGTLAKSGGKVVKNVAGYDLGRLFTGSYGTLGVIASVTFKLQPLPAARRVVVVDATEPGAVAAALRRSTAAPAAAEWDGQRVHVLVEASPSAIDSIAADLATALSTDEVSDRLPATFGARPWAAGEVALKVTHRLSALDEVVSVTRACLPGARTSAHVGSGVVWAGSPETEPDAVAGAVGELRGALEPYDGGVVVVDAPDAVKRAVDVWGPVPAAALMHSVKERFDPGHRLNRGRFVDGI